MLVNISEIFILLFTIFYRRFTLLDIYYTAGGPFLYIYLVGQTTFAQSFISNRGAMESAEINDLIILLDLD